MESVSKTLVEKSYRTKNIWVLKHHSNDNNMWRDQDYIFRCKIESLKDLWGMYNAIPIQLGGLKDNQYFLMREGINPTWEHPANKKGTIYSIQMKEEIMLVAFTVLTSLIVGGTFSNKNLYINGIEFKYSREKKKGMEIIPASALLKIWSQKKTPEIALAIKKYIEVILPKYVDKKYHSYKPTVQTTDINPQY